MLDYREKVSGDGASSEDETGFAFDDEDDAADALAKFGEFSAALLCCSNATILYRSGLQRKHARIINKPVKNP